MVTFLVSIIVIESLALIALGFYILKRRQYFKRAESNFVTYLDRLDKNNTLLKSRIYKLKNESKG